MGAIGNTLIFEQGCFWGMESVKITSVSFDFSIFSYALPERTAWVATARTLAAPLSISISAALQIVPAVSIMSSTTMIFLPSTSPITFMSATSFARIRVLWQMNNPYSKYFAQEFALLAPPMSGEAMAKSRNPKDLM